MPATVALSAELAALAARVLSLENSRTADEAAIKALLAEVIADEGKIAALTPPIVVPPIVVPPYDPQVLWRATMANGDLNEWLSNGTQENSGSAITTVVLASAEGIPPHGGSYVMKQAVTGAVGGTRMVRYPEVTALVKAGTPFWVTWYDYYPSAIGFGPADMWNFWEIGGVDSAGSYNPVWALLADQKFAPLLCWSPNDKAPAEGPHAGEAGKRYYTSSTPIPVGQWAKFEAYIKPAADFTGALQIWLNGNLLFDLAGIKTRYPGTGDPSIPGFMFLLHNAYGSNLTPTPAVHFVDDVTYSLGRMP